MFGDMPRHVNDNDGGLEPGLPTCSYHQQNSGVKDEVGKEKYSAMYPIVSSSETSPCPSSTGVDGQDTERQLVSPGDGDGVDEESERGDGGMPFLARPLLGCEAGMDGAWLKPGNEAIAWLDLFYGTSPSSPCPRDYP